MKLARVLAAGLVLLLLGVGGYYARYGKLPFLVQKDRWAIAIYAGDSPLRLAPLSGFTDPILTAAQVTDVPAEFVADPFLLRDGETWHLFFEVLNGRSGRGEIGLATSADGRHWEYRGIVLAEPFHLSYPHVFAWQGEIYMVPESIAAGQVLLYRASDFPARWEPAGVLIDGVRLADPSLLRRDGRWWLFGKGARNTLRLYSAQELAGPWREHPQSPLVSGDPHRARPGGRIVEAGGRLLRFTQDGYPRYGSRVLAFEIKELTAERYREEAVPETVLEGSGAGWNRDGMHHLDAHQVGEGEWLAAVDGFYEYWTFGFSP